MPRGSCEVATLPSAEHLSLLRNNTVSPGKSFTDERFICWINTDAALEIRDHARSVSLHIRNPTQAALIIPVSRVVSLGNCARTSRTFLRFKQIVSFGGDFDFGISAAAQSGNFQWLPDFNLEIILTKDRQLRAIIFSKNSLDINAGALGRTSRQGAGLSYKKDFEKLFGNKEKNTTIKPPADSTLIQ